MRAESLGKFAYDECGEVLAADWARALSLACDCCLIFTDIFSSSIWIASYWLKFAWVLVF